MDDLVTILALFGLDGAEVLRWAGAVVAVLVAAKAVLPAARALLRLLSGAADRTRTLVDDRIVDALTAGLDGLESAIAFVERLNVIRKPAALESPRLRRKVVTMLVLCLAGCGTLGSAETVRRSLPALAEIAAPVISKALGQHVNTDDVFCFALAP